MPIQKPEMILIDVDGTLVDSVPDLAYCVDEVMKQLDMPVRGEGRVRHWVGNGVERLVRRALINELDGEPDEALFEKAYPIFLDLYTENNSGRSSLYPGVSEGLDYMQATGYRLGCVTNKAAQFTIPILKALDIPMQDVEVFAPSQAVDVVRRINAWSPSDQGGVPWQHRRALAPPRRCRVREP